MVRLPASSVVINSPARLRPSRISLPFHRCGLTVCDHGWWSQCPFKFLSANHWLRPCRSIEASADDDPSLLLLSQKLSRCSLRPSPPIRPPCALRVRLPCLLARTLQQPNFF